MRFDGQSGGESAPQQAPVTPPSTRKIWARRLGAIASIAIFAISVVVLVSTFATLNIASLRDSVRATGIDQVALAALLTAFSYLALTGYDALALRQLRVRVRYRTAALASFTSYAASFTLGFPLITGGTVRYWIYSQVGLSATKVASLTIVAGVTFWLGMALVIGVGLLFQPAAVARINHLTPLTNLSLGFAITATIVVYLIWVSVKPRSASFQDMRLELPGFRVTLGQIVLGVCDLCGAAGALFMLLPEGHGLDFLTFLAVYVFGALLGIASHAPGGIGVFEATLINAVPAPSQEALLASLLLFRIIYYIVPFILALALLGANEAVRRWRGLREAMEQSQDDEA